MKILQLLDDKWFHFGEEIACKKILRYANIIELENFGKFLCKMKEKCENGVTTRHAMCV